MSQTELTAAHCTNVLVVAITPRGPDGGLDLDGTRGNVEHLIDRGADFLMPMCGTGLVYDATLDEYEAVVGTFVDCAGDRALVVPGIGPGYGRALEMAAIARSAGVAGVMIMPIVGPASDNGARTGLAAIARTIRLPTVLYQRRLDIMPVDHVVELCRMDEVVSLKYAVDDIAAFSKIVDRASDSAAMICGMAEDPCLEYLAAGAVGFSSGMANFVPGLSLALLRAFRAGDQLEAERIRGLMVPFEDFRGEDMARYSSSALHAAMTCAGLAAGPVVPFAEPVASRDLPRVQELVSQLLAEENRIRPDAATDGGESAVARARE